MYLYSVSEGAADMQSCEMSQSSWVRTFQLAPSPGTGATIHSGKPLWDPSPLQPAPEADPGACAHLSTHSTYPMSSVADR